MAILENEQNRLNMAIAEHKAAEDETAEDGTTEDKTAEDGACNHAGVADPQLIRLCVFASPTSIPKADEDTAFKSLDCPSSASAASLNAKQPKFG